MPLTPQTRIAELILLWVGVAVVVALAVKFIISMFN